MANVWIFSNHHVDYYGDSDWDTSTILKSKKYYFKVAEKNRFKVKNGDRVIFREYGSGFWGESVILDNWTDDPDAVDKHEIKAGWFPLGKIKKWSTTLPYEIIRSELSNQNHRIRIAGANDRDYENILLAFRLYKNLGHGSTDGSFFILESGIEEAVKANLSQLGLELAEDEINQQCSLGIGIGRTDLICRDNSGNFVVLELKAIQSSDYVVGQILRYMGYIREQWAEKEGKDVSGIILTPSFDEQLRLAAKESGIRVLRIRIQ